MAYLPSFMLSGKPGLVHIGTDGLLAHTHVGEISREVLLSRIARLQ
jgi:hypothetical protein